MFFEAVMMICFGASWPFAILKTIRAKNPAGKSYLFMVLIMLGYLSGCIYKFLYRMDAVFYLYAFNGVLVATDMILCLYYRKRLERISRTA